MPFFHYGIFPAIGARERDNGGTVENLLTISSAVQRFDNGSLEVINIVSSENAVVLTPIVDLVMCGGKSCYITLHVLFSIICGRSMYSYMLYNPSSNHASTGTNGNTNIVFDNIAFTSKYMF